jgi:hypothetical protein
MYNLSNHAVTLLGSYLSDRTFQVSAGSPFSNIYNSQCGVPQGSCLGPLLFSAYVAPVTSVVTACGFSYHYYADDLLIYGTIDRYNIAKSLSDLSACLEDVRMWFTSNYMVINPDKTECLVIGTPILVSRFLPEIAFTFAGSVIRPSPTLKYLGVILDSSLSFAQHCHSVAAAVRRVPRTIRHFRGSFDVAVASGLAVSLGLSKLDYCSSVLIKTTASNIRCLQAAQNALARAVWNVPWYSSTKPILHSLHWLPVESRIQFMVCSLVARAQAGQLPGYIA